MDDREPSTHEPKFRLDGEPDGRGHAEGSKSTRFAANDGRKRPGRPKNAISMKKLYLAVANERMRDPKTRALTKVTAYGAMVLKQRAKAIAGDENAMKRFEARIAEYCPEPVDLASTSKLLEEDRILLALAAGRGLIVPPTSEGESGND